METSRILNAHILTCFGMDMKDIGGRPIESNEPPKTRILTGNPHLGAKEQTYTGPYVEPMMMIESSNGQATASMVLGIVTWVLHFLTPVIGFTCCIAPFTTIAGVITGHIGLTNSKQMNGLGKGMAIAGVVMNYISVILYLIILGLFAWLGIELGAF